MLTRLAAIPLLFASMTVAAPPTRDVVFASPDGHDLKLDLFLPKEEVDNQPLVVFIHGGGWMKGSYKNCRIPWLKDEGFALASISYRLSDVAKFPAQIHDCKAAIRWLRAHADVYDYDATRIGVAGTSAGGHLALMLGTTAGVEELEGTVGSHVDQSSTVQAVVNYFGPSDFVFRSTNQPSKTDRPGGGVYELLGGPVKELAERAKLASPITHVSANDPPLLTLHGDKDQTVFLDQAERIDAVYRAIGLDVHTIVIAGGGHGSGGFFEGENRRAVCEFLREHLK